MTDKIAYRLSEIPPLIGIGKSKLFELIAAGEIKTLKVGHRTLIERAELEAFFDRLRERQQAA